MVFSTRIRKLCSLSSIPPPVDAYCIEDERGAVASFPISCADLGRRYAGC